VSDADWQAQTLGAVLAGHAAGRGAAEALVAGAERGRTRLGYAQLQDAVLRTAAGLRALGLARGDHVAIFMGNDENWLTLFYAAAKLGCVTVPVNTRFKAAELAFCLRQADCRAVFYAPRFLGIDFEAMVREAAPQCPLLEYIVSVAAGLPAATPDAALGADVRPDDPLLIQFTSGTTAYPKGVLLTHDNMLRNAWAAGTRMGVRAEDRYFNCRPFFHVGGSTLSALVALVFGACMVTLPTFEAGAALQAMQEERCTLTSGNDTIFQMLMGHPDFDPARLQLRGGWAAAGPQTVRRIIDVMGARNICIAYGLSEASPNVVISDWRDPEELRVAGTRQAACGRAGAHRRRGTNWRCPPARRAKYRCAGWNVMRGYYNDPEQTAKAFTSDGWLRTGDLGTLTEGRPPAHGRATEGRFPRRRRERRAGRGRGGVARASRGADRAGDRRSRYAPGRGGLRLRQPACRRAGRRGRTDRLGEAALCELPRAKVPAHRGQFRSDRHDRQRQGAEGQAARARDRRVQTAGIDRRPSTA
jgi:fatty-acyl-CoA synthase